jgi:hypothetical protein
MALGDDPCVLRKALTLHPGAFLMNPEGKMGKGLGKFSKVVPGLEANLRI